MILLFGNRRNFGHERKCLGEVAKLELFMQSAIDHLPFAVHATTLDCRAEIELVQRGVAGNSAMLARRKRWSFTGATGCKFR